MTLSVIDRSTWGARDAKPGVTSRSLDVLTTWVDHYADAACLPYLPNEEAACRAIQDWHMDHNGWLDIGYHFLIGNGGDVLAGRRVDQVGAHCAGFNVESIGVCFLTDGGISPQAGAAFVELVQTIEYVVLHRQLRIDKHNEHVQTTCPGELVSGWTDRVRYPGGPLYRPSS